MINRYLFIYNQSTSLAELELDQWYNILNFYIYVVRLLLILGLYSVVKNPLIEYVLCLRASAGVFNIPGDINILVDMPLVKVFFARSIEIKLFMTVAVVFGVLL